MCRQAGRQGGTVGSGQACMCARRHTAAHLRGSVAVALGASVAGLELWRGGPALQGRAGQGQHACPRRHGASRAARCACMQRPSLACTHARRKMRASAAACCCRYVQRVCVRVCAVPVLSCHADRADGGSALCSMMHHPRGSSIACRQRDCE